MGNHAERWMMGLLVLQLLIGVMMLVVWTEGGKAPGSFMGAGVTLLGWLSMKQGWLPKRSILTVAVVCAGLGLLYPWPWIRVSDSEVERTATVRKLAGPDGCVCVGLAVPPLLDEDPSSAQAQAFCMPDSDGRFLPWLDAGTVPTQWSISLRSTAMDTPVLYATELRGVGGIKAAILHSNNGCRL